MVRKHRLFAGPQFTQRRTVASQVESANGYEMGRRFALFLSTEVAGRRQLLMSVASR